MKELSAASSFIGVICPGVFEDGIKIGVEAWLLSGEREPKETFILARRRDLVEDIPADDTGLGWVFDPQAIERVNEHLRSLLAQTAQDIGNRSSLSAFNPDNSLDLLKPQSIRDSSCSQAPRMRSDLFPVPDSSNPVLLIDEIGPLELVSNKGFIAALELLDAVIYPDALVVIRSSLIEIACSRWQDLYDIEIIEP